MNNSSGARDVTFSPDGKYIVTANNDKTAGVWNAFTGERIAVLKHDAEITDVEFSPVENTLQLRVEIKQRVYGMHLQEKKTLSLRHDGEVRDIVFSPDGKYIATASRDNTAGVWDAYTGKEVAGLNIMLW